LFVRESLPQWFEVRAEAGELLEMCVGQCDELLLAAGRQAQAHEPVVVAIGDTFDEPGAFGAVDQLDDAVMPEQEMCGDLADGWRITVAADGEEQLVLRAGDADPVGLVLAPAEEPAQPVAKRQEALEVRVGQSFGTSGHGNISY